MFHTRTFFLNFVSLILLVGNLESLFAAFVGDDCMMYNTKLKTGQLKMQSGWLFGSLQNYQYPVERSIVSNINKHTSLAVGSE